MKYIRTKDGIYKTMFENEELLMCFDHTTIEPAYYSVDHEWIPKRDVIKEADTIEELCDEFVQETNCFGDKPIVIKSNTFSTIVGIAKEYTVYGAIWTDKGLIYVAKMNDNGELELI